MILHRVFSDLLQRPSARIAAGLILGQLAIYAATPLVSRLFTPAQVGHAGTFLAAASILGAVSTLRWESLLARCLDTTAAAATRAALASIGLISTLAAVASLAVLELDEALLFAITVSSLGLIGLATQWSARLNDMQGLSLAKIGQGIGQSATQICAGFVGSLRLGLQLGFATGYVVSALTQWLVLLRRHRLRSFTAIPGSLTKPQVFAVLGLSFATLINLGTVWAQLLILSRGYNAEIVGQYSLAQRLSIAPAGLAVAALSPPLLANVGLRLREEKDIWPPVSKMLLSLAPVTAIVSIGILIVPSSWVTGILGPDWAPVKSYAAALTPLIFGLIVVGPASQVLAIAGKTRLQLYWDLSRAVAMFSAGMYLVSNSASALTVVAATSTILLLWYAIYVLLIYRSAQHQRMNHE